jgi:hypothetical protein
MSAPISIPIAIQDDGTAALQKLAQGFTETYTQADKLAQGFGTAERAANAFQTRIEAGTKALQEMAGVGGNLTKSLGLIGDAFKLVGDIVT